METDETARAFDEEDTEPQDETEDTEEGEEVTQRVTQRVTHRARGRARGKTNASVRQAQALNLRGQGWTFEEIAAKCGYSHKSVARRAVLAAARDIALDTAEEARLTFKASYGPVRQALHAKARIGDVRAAEALVKLDERECRLFGLDLTPDAAALSANYTKRIILEEWTPPAPSIVPTDGSHNGHSEAIWGDGGYKATHQLND